MRPLVSAASSESSTSSSVKAAAWWDSGEALESATTCASALPERRGLCTGGWQRRGWSENGSDGVPRAEAQLRHRCLRRQGTPVHRVKDDRFRLHTCPSAEAADDPPQLVRGCRFHHRRPTELRRSATAEQRDGQEDVRHGGEGQLQRRVRLPQPARREFGFRSFWLVRGRNYRAHL